MGETDYQTPLDLPYTRLRVHVLTTKGVADQFLFRLEYNRDMIKQGPGGWGPVAQFDHNPSAPDGHDITAEGLHLDLFSLDGEKYQVRRGFPWVSLADAPGYCEDVLRERADELTRRYERYNEIEDGRYGR